MSPSRRATLIAIVVALGLSVACAGDRRIDPPSDTELAFAHAESTYYRGAHDSARVELAALLARAEASGDSASMGRALTRLAVVAWRKADYPLTRRLAERALAMKLRAQDVFFAYNSLGLSAWNEGRHAEATEWLDKAIAAARAMHDSLNAAKAEMNHGLVDTKLGDYARARENFVGARSTARLLGDTRLEGKCLANLAMLEIEVGDPIAAIALLDTARAIYRVTDYATGEQNALGQLGVAYAAIGEPQRALAALDSALTQSREQNLPQEEASNLQLLAEQYRDAGDLSRALQYLAQAQTLNESLGLDDDRGTALRDAGEVYLSLGQHRLARRRALEALDVHRRSESLLEQLADHLLLAQVDERAKRMAAVDSALAGAGEIADRLATRDARGRVVLAAAEIADRSRGPRDVLAVLDSAPTDLAASASTEARTLGLRARAHRRLGQLDSAAAIGLRAMYAVERVRGRYATGALRTAYAWQYGDIYADLVLVLLQQHRVEEAFRVADAARGRALLEHLTEAGRAAARSAGAARELVEAEVLLRRIDELATRLRNHPAQAPNERGRVADHAEDDLVARIGRARSDYEALVERATHRDVPGSTLLGASRVDLAAVRGALRSDEILLEYFVTADRLLIFVVTRDSVFPIAVNVSSEQIASRTRLARELLGRRDARSGAAYAALGSLYTSLIAPVRRASALDGTSRLVIVPHGALAYLPFAALRNPADGRFLVQDFTTTYVPSSATFALARRAEAGREQGPDGPATALAPFPVDLPATLVEAQRVSQLVAGVAVTGSEASEMAFRQALETAPLVHVATHAELNTQNPMFSSIALTSTGLGNRSDDGRLEVHELLGMHVRSSLVFLSGCETGVGAAWSSAFRQGEDFTTLAQAFLYAGARSVVATLWRIEDGAAATFAEQFYENLRRMPPPDALAAAQRSMLVNPKYASPYDWAAYTVTGSVPIPMIASAAPRASEPPAARAVR